MSIEAIGAPAPVAMDVDMSSPDGLKPIGLHSPPDSNNAIGVDGSDSELSDLDDEIASKLDVSLGIEPQVEAQVELEPEPQPPANDIGEILPDHWSGNVPVFKPTMKQFEDFIRFMESVNDYGMKSGIIKIIPPQEWKESLGPLDDRIKHIRVREPIKQEIMGTNGTYRQVNVLHQRTYNLPQWRQLCDQSEHQPPARRGERRANADKKPPTRSRAAAHQNTRPVPPAPSTRKRRGGRATRRSTRAAKEETEEPEERPMTPVSPVPEKEEIVDSVENDPGVKAEECEDEDDAPVVRRMGFARQSKPKTQSISARRKNIRREGSAVIDEAAFKDWDYRMDISEFTPERCEELEKIYWKTLTYAPPLYGADLPGTLFDEDTKLWNLNKLPNLLDVIGTKVPGVNTAYLYLGMWKATFAWHLEDVDLYSINYLHFGAPKQWYSISQADARRFENAMKNIWPQEAKACDQFLRHKSFLISPSHLKQHYNITVNKVVSYPGEFVVTYPYGYHSGYNLGYNCAEAVNFALDSWLPMGKIAKKCQCAQAQDSVWVDVYDIERKLRGEETEYEETEDEDEEDEEDEEEETGLPSPPSSHAVRVKVPGRKRKRAANEKEPKAKRRKIRLRLKPHFEPPCCLCPNDIPGAEIMPTDDGRKAHRMCALYLPETYIETVDGKEIIANVAGIAKDRLDLKCLYCRSKKGACFQCSQKKCPRAYHATCAAAAGVFVEEGEVPVFGEDGTEYKEQAFEFSCRFHRTKRDRKAEGDVLENNHQVREAAKALKKTDICQLQYYRGDIFAGVVVENRIDEETLLLDIIPNGDRLEVEWKWLLLPDPSDFRLPKASPNAIPMPTCRKTQKEINAKRAVDEAPRKDDEFAPGYVWAEFHTADAVKNREQTKVDLFKENQLWHYLGKTSTEAKAQYTEEPSKPWHNPKANFLDTIPKPVAALRMHPAPRARPSVSASYPAYQAVSGVLPGTTSAKQEKPYTYKPRKPVAPRPSAHSALFTSHMFALNSPSPSAGFQQLRPQQAFLPAFQLMSSQQPQQYVQQAQPQPQPQPQQARSSVQQQQSPGLHTQNKSPSTLYSSSNRFAPVGGSNGFPKLPGLTWPPAHMKSGQYVQPQSRAWSSSTGATPSMLHSAPMTSSALRHTNVGDRQTGVAGTQPQNSACQKYSFFQVHHNRDSSRYRTPYGQWGGFTNGYEGNLRDFLLKAQKALSGGSGKTQIKQVPPSLLKPLQPRPGASPGPNTPSYPHHAAPYAQILPRPSSNALQTPSPHAAMATSSPYQAQTYQNQGHPMPMVPGGQSYDIEQPESGQPHPAIRPQYGAPQTQPITQTSHHARIPVTQPLDSATQPLQSSEQAKPAFAKQSHSPIPLPPYVKQIPTSSQSAPGPSPLGGHTEQAALHITPQKDSASTTGLTPPQVNGKAIEAPALSTEAHMDPSPNGQWTPPNINEPSLTAATPWGPPAPGPTPGPTTQSSPGFQTWEHPPQAQPLQGSATISLTRDVQDNNIYVERVMMNLRRASMHFGGFGTNQG